MTRAVNRLPSRRAKILLGAMPVLLAVAAYWVASDARQAMDAGDKLMPGLEAFRAAMSRLMFDIDRMTGQRLFWADTAASLARLGVGLGISAVLGQVIGLFVGIIPFLRAIFEPIFAALSLIPPLPPASPSSCRSSARWR